MIPSSSPPPFLYNTKLKRDPMLKVGNARASSELVPDRLRLAKHASPAEHVPHVIVVGGPGMGVFTPNEVSDVARRLACIASQCELVLNDGDEPSAKQPVAMGLVTSLRASADKPVLLFVRTHGNVADNGSFSTEFDDGIALPGAPLLHLIGSLRQVPVQMFMSSCQGWRLLEGVHALPEGSVVVVLAPEGRNVCSDDVRTLNVHLDKLKSLNTFSLLLLYCACALMSKTPPSVFMPNGVVIDLECQLDSIRKKRLGKADRELIHQQLDDLVGASRVTHSIQLIENLDSVQSLDEREYGMALAVAAVLSGVVVEPRASAPSVSQPQVHNVIRRSVETVQSRELPQLNLNHEGVRAALAQRGKAIVLPGTSGIYLSKDLDRMLLKLNDQVAVVMLERLVIGDVFKVKDIQGRPEVIAHFQKIGVLQANPASQAFGPSITTFV